MNELQGPFFDQPPDPSDREKVLEQEGRLLQSIIKKLKREGKFNRQADLYHEAFIRMKEQGVDLRNYVSPEGKSLNYLFEPSTGKLVPYSGILIGVDASLEGQDVIPAVALSSEGNILVNLFPNEPPDPPTLAGLIDESDVSE